MPAPMPPQGAPAPDQGAPAQDQGGGPVSDLVAGIHDGMTHLLSMLPDEDKAGLSQIIQGYEAFVQNVLGAPSGPQGKPANNQNMPPEAGAGAVTPVA